jgi:hypothetical protein
MFALKHFAHGSYVCGLCLAVLSLKNVSYTISLTLLMPLFFILNALFLSTGLFSLKKYCLSALVLLIVSHLSINFINFRQKDFQMMIKILCHELQCAFVQFV